MTHLTNKGRNLGFLFLLSLSTLFQSNSFAQTPCSDPMDWEILNSLFTNVDIDRNNVEIEVWHSSSLSFQDNIPPYKNPSDDDGSYSNPTYRIQIVKWSGSLPYPSFDYHTGFHCNTSNMNFTGTLSGTTELIVNEAFSETSSSSTIYKKNNLEVGTYLVCIRLGTTKAHSKYKLLSSFEITDAGDDFYITDAQLSSTNVNAGTSVTASCNQYYAGSSTSILISYMDYVLSDDLVFGDADDNHLSTDISGIGATDLFDEESANLSIPANTITGNYYILFVADAPDDFEEVDETNNIAYVSIYINGIPPTPANVQASDGDYCDKVRITWDASDGAKSYKVYRNGFLITTTTNLYYDYAYAPTTKSNYTVRAINDNGDESDISDSDEGYKEAKPNSPQNLVATDGTNSQFVRISWDVEDNVERYIVKRDGVIIRNNIPPTSGIYIEDYKTEINANTEYTYEVIAENDCGEATSNQENGYRCFEYNLQVTSLQKSNIIYRNLPKKPMKATIQNNGLDAFTGTVYLHWENISTGEVIGLTSVAGINLNTNDNIEISSDSDPVISPTGNYKLIVGYNDPDAIGNCGGNKTIREESVIVRKPRPNPPNAKNGDPINMLTGEFLQGHNDFLISTSEGVIPFQRRYQSGSNYNRGFGKKWIHNFDIYLELESDVWTLHNGDGSETYFIPDGSNGSEVIPSFSTDTLYFQVYQYILEKKNGTKYYFDTAGRITEIVFASNNKISFNYENGVSVSKRLFKIEFPPNDTRYLKITYHAGTDKIKEIRDNANRTTSYVYDSNENLTEATNVRGGIVKYGYDSNSFLTTIQDARGVDILENEYDGLGRVWRQKDTEKYAYIWYDSPIGSNKTIFQDITGKTTIYRHDEYDRLASITNALGDSSYIVYDGFSYRPKVIVDENGDSTQLAYDENANLIQITNPLKGSLFIGYTDNLPTSFSNSLYLDEFIEVTYNNQNKATKIKFPNEGEITVEYNDPTFTGLLSSIKDLQDNEYTFSRNSFGDITTISTPKEDYIFDYDNAGKIKSITDRNANTTYFETDAYGNITKISNAITTIFQTYNENGYLISERIEGGDSTRYEYDNRNLLTKVTDAEDNYIAFNRDDFGRLETIRNNKNELLLSFDEYDQLDRVKSLSDSLGTYHYGYDKISNLAFSTNLYGDTSKVSYNALGLPTTFSFQDEILGTIGYNELGQILSFANASGDSTKLTYDVMGWLKTVTDPMTETVEYTYDVAGNITNINDAGGFDTNFKPNKIFNLPESIENPAKQNSHIKYDNEGYVTEYTDEEDITAIIARDENDFITSISLPNSNGYAYEWDKNGLLLKAKKYTQSENPITVTRDAIGDITEITEYHKNTIQYEHDPLYRWTKIIYPNEEGDTSEEKAVITHYNILGQPILTVDWLNNYVVRSYNEYGQLDSLTFSNGLKTVLSYDDSRRLESYTNSLPDGTILSENFLSYDKNNRVVENKTILPLSPDFETLVEEYDRLDDGTLTKAGDKTYQNNNNGARTLTTGAVEESYEWADDDFDVLKEYTRAGVKNTLTFDALGNRVLKVNDTETTQYIIDNNNDLPQVIQERDENGKIKASYIYTPNGLGWRIDENGEAQFYAFDFIGHTIALVDEAGNISDKYAYDLFGNFFNHEGESKQPFTFLGKYGIQNEGEELYYIRARFYDASVGTFISKDTYPADPINTQSFNRFHYALNDPLTYVDIDGLYYQFPNYDNVYNGFDNTSLQATNNFSRDLANAENSNPKPKGQDYISVYGSVSIDNSNIQGYGLQGFDYNSVNRLNDGATIDIEGVAYTILNDLKEGADFLILDDINACIDGSVLNCAAAALTIIPTGKVGIVLGKGLVKYGGKTYKVVKSLFKKTSRAIRPVGQLLESIEDIMANPDLLKGKTPQQIEQILKGTKGWKIEPLGKGSNQGRGWTFKEYTPRGHPTGRQIRWNPSKKGGRHGDLPYWRVVGYEGDLGGIIR